MSVRGYSLLILATTIPLLIGAAGCGGHPSDEKLASVFRQHRGAFERLVQMSDEDRNVVRIAPTFTRLVNDWSWPRPAARLGISVDRWQQYLNLFKETGLEEGLERSENSDAVWLIASARGLLNRGSSKGYVHRTVPPALVVYDSADGKQPQLSSNDVGFKALGENWYIFYDGRH